MSADWRDRLPAQLLTLRVIVAAMVSGCVVFAAIALVVAGGQLAEPGLFTYAALAMGLSAVVARLVVLPAVDAAAVQRIAASGAQADDGIALLAQLQTRTIIGAALLEGPVFLLLVAFLAERSALALVAAGVVLLWLASQFPMHAGAANWIENQLLRVADERSLRR